MQRPLRPSEVALLLFAVASALVGFGLPSPPAVHPLWVLQAWAVKGGSLFAAVLAGAVLVGSVRSEVAWFDTRRGRETAARVGLALAGLGVSLVGAEAVLQLVAPEAPENWLRPDPVFHHSQKPDFTTRFVSSEWNTEVRTNGLGLRDRELPPRSEKTRVVVLGDSYAFGWGVEEEEAFPQALDALCRAEALPAEVVNAAIPSYSPTLEYLLLREGWSQLEPDVVVLAVDMSDFQDDLWFEDLAVFSPEGRLVAVRPTPRPGRVKQWYKDRLVVKTMRLAMDALYSRLRSGREFAAPQTRSLVHNRFALTRDDLDPADERPHWERTERWIREIHRLTAERGGHLLLTTYPYGHQVSPHEWEAGRHHYGFSATKTYSDRPAKIMAAFAGAEGIPFLDLFPVIRQASDGALYFDFDGHFTPRTHDLVARALLDRLRELGWLVPRPRFDHS